jgi:hypothetical protein
VPKRSRGAGRPRALAATVPSRYVLLDSLEIASPESALTTTSSGPRRFEVAGPQCEAS